MHTRPALLLLALALALASTGCLGTSQWVIVTDCADHRPIPGASVWTYHAEDPNWTEANVSNHADPAEGGKTDADGVTWARFPKLVVRRVRASTSTSRGGTIEKSGKPNPWTTVPPGAPEQIDACVERKNR